MTTCHFEKKSPESTVDLSVLEVPGFVEMILPIYLRSEGNNSDFWARKKLRHDKQKKLTNSGLEKIKNKPELPCKITLTRVAPRKLDFDNLAFAFKWILDTVCAYLVPGKRPGRADSDERISVNYSQQKGAYAVKITLMYT